MNARVALTLALLCVAALSVSAQSTAFTYQGHLMDGGASANGNYDIQFTLKDAFTSGATVGTPQAVSPVTAVNGIFTVTLDFGSTPFDGSDRWVELGVRPAGSVAAYTVLAPRQKLTATPYATRSLNASAAGSATSLTGTLTAGNIPSNLITGAMLANNTITSTQIQNNAIGTSQLATGAVTLSKIAVASASGYLAQGTLSGLATGTATATVNFPQAFATAPPVVIQQPGWTLGAVTTTGFSATTPFAPVTVDSAGITGSYTSLAAVDGRPAISYYDTTNGDLRFAIAPGADGSGTWTTVTVDSAGNTGRDTSLAVVDGRPAISYHDITNGDLRFAIAPGADGSGAWTTVTVDSAGNTGIDTSLAVVNGRPAISYFDSTNSDLRFAIAPNADGSGTWTTVTVDSAGNTGVQSSLAVVNGRPAISYHDDTNGDLRFAIAISPGGSGTWTTVTVDSAGDTGRYTSLEVVNGRPAISYTNDDNNDLRFAIAPNADGSGTWTTVTVESFGFGGGIHWGSYTSLAVVDGRPAISYKHPSVYLRFAIAPSADGSGTWNTVRVDGFGIFLGLHTSLAVINGRPAISYTNDDHNDLRFALLPDAPWFAGDATASATVLASGVQAGAVGTVQIAANAVTSEQIAAAAVDGSKIANSSITAAKLDASLSATLARLDSTQTFTAANTFSNAGNSFTGSGAGLTALNALNLSTGTLSDARLSSNVALRGAAQTFTDVNTFSNAGNSFTGSGAGLTALNASNLSTGTLLDARLTSNVALRGAAQSFTAANTFSNAGNSFTGSGAGLTALNASNLSTGTLPDARLSSNVALRGAANTFAFSQTINAAAQDPLNVTSSHTGGSWLNLTNSNGARTWSAIVTGTSNSEGAGKLLLRDATGNAVRLIIDTAGLTGIGRNPTTNRLEVEGDASKATAGSWLANSDRRIKEDIQPVTNALDTLDKVRLVDFRYTDAYRGEHPGITDQRYLNVVAQEFAEVFPNHVKSSGEKLPDGSEILQVDTYPLTIYSAAAVQELNKKHTDDMKALRLENAELKKRLERLEKLLEKGVEK